MACFPLDSHRTSFHPALDFDPVPLSSTPSRGTNSHDLHLHARSSALPYVAVPNLTAHRHQALDSAKHDIIAQHLGQMTEAMIDVMRQQSPPQTST